MTLKIAAFAPMPRPSVAMTATLKPALRDSIRAPWRASCSSWSIHHGIQTARVSSFTIATLPNFRAETIRVVMLIQTDGRSLGTPINVASTAIS